MVPSRPPATALIGLSVDERLVQRTEDLNPTSATKAAVVLRRLRNPGHLDHVDAAGFRWLRRRIRDAADLAIEAEAANDISHHDVAAIDDGVVAALRQRHGADLWPDAGSITHGHREGDRFGHVNPGVW